MEPEQIEDNQVRLRQFNYWVTYVSYSYKVYLYQEWSVTLYWVKNQEQSRKMEHFEL